MELGDLVKAIKAKSGMTYDSLSEATGMYTMTIQNLVSTGRNRKDARTSSFIKFFKGCGYNVVVIPNDCPLPKEGFVIHAIDNVEEISPSS